jgi:hypothetical protein
LSPSYLNMAVNEGEKIAGLGEILQVYLRDKHFLFCID